LKKKPRTYHEKAPKACLAIVSIEAAQWKSSEGNFLARVERRSAQLPTSGACRYLDDLDQQYLPGDEPSDPVEDLFCAM